MSQSKFGSLLEAISNTVLGYVIAITVMTWLYKVYDVPITPSQVVQITAIMTVVSILRGYLLRRMYNAWPRLRRWLKLVWLKHRYRHIDPEVCCCGGYVGKGCQMGCCRSAKEYAISQELEDGR